MMQLSEAAAMLGAALTGADAQVLRVCTDSRNVQPGTRISTDDHRSYRHLGRVGFTHEVVEHSTGEYVRGDVHTNTIEAFWAMVKRTSAGTHIWGSPKHLPKYLWEIEYRWNLRKQQHLMFPLLLQAFPRP